MANTSEMTREQEHAAEELALTYDQVGVEMDGENARCRCVIFGQAGTCGLGSGTSDKVARLVLDPDGKRVAA